MARRPTRYSEDDFESLDGRASKTEQKKAVQRLSAIGAQLAELNKEQIQQLPVDDRLIDALLDVQIMTSFEACRRQFQRIGKLLRNEDEQVILSYLTPKQGSRKIAQLQRWAERMIEQGDSAIHEFSKSYNACERHTLRQHVLRIIRDKQQNPDQVESSTQKLMNYIQQVVLLSD